MMYYDMEFFDKEPKWKYKNIEPPKSLLITDDILGSPAISSSSGLVKIATLNRHIAPLQQNYNWRSACGLAVIILSQSYRMQSGQGIGRSDFFRWLYTYLPVGPPTRDTCRDDVGRYELAPQTSKLSPSSPSRRTFGLLAVQRSVAFPSQESLPCTSWHALHHHRLRAAARRA